MIPSIEIPVRVTVGWTLCWAEDMGWTRLVSQSWNSGGTEVPGGTLEASHRTWNSTRGCHHVPRGPRPISFFWPLSLSFIPPGTCCSLIPLAAGPLHGLCALPESLFPRYLLGLLPRFFCVSAVKSLSGRHFSQFDLGKMAVSISPDVLTLSYFLIAFGTTRHIILLTFVHLYSPVERKLSEGSDLVRLIVTATAGEEYLALSDCSASVAKCVSDVGR